MFHDPGPGLPDRQRAEKKRQGLCTKIYPPLTDLCAEMSAAVMAEYMVSTIRRGTAEPVHILITHNSL
jgi:hypothetical protein